MNRIPKAVYTKKFRVVKLAQTEGLGVSEAARRRSIRMKSLANRVRAAKADKLKTVRQGQKTLTDLEMELNRVKRELAEVKMERDLLKKHLNGRAPARRAETPRHKYTDAHQGERPSNYW